MDANKVVKELKLNAQNNIIQNNAKVRKLEKELSSLGKSYESLADSIMVKLELQSVRAHNDVWNEVVAFLDEQMKK